MNREPDSRSKAIELNPHGVTEGPRNICPTYNVQFSILASHLPENSRYKLEEIHQYFPELLSDIYKIYLKHQSIIPIKFLLALYCSSTINEIAANSLPELRLSFAVFDYIQKKYPYINLTAQCNFLQPYLLNANNFNSFSKYLKVYFSPDCTAETDEPELKTFAFAVTEFIATHIQK